MQQMAQESAAEWGAQVGGGTFQGPLKWQIQIHGSRCSSEQHTLSRFIAMPAFSSSHKATLQIALQRAAQGDARMCVTPGEGRAQSNEQ